MVFNSDEWLSSRHTDVKRVLVTRTCTSIDNIRAEKNGERKCKVEIRKYFKSLVGLFLNIAGIFCLSSIMIL